MKHNISNYFNSVSNHLAQIDLSRKGKGRIWSMDKGWYYLLVEFQPQSGRTGTCLNVGIDLLWNETPALVYIIGGRVNEFVEFISQDQFENELNKLSHIAINKVNDYLETMSDRDKRLKFLNECFEDQSDRRNVFHLAIVNLFQGQTNEALNLLDQVIERECKFQPEINLRNLAYLLKAEAQTNQDKMTLMRKIINKSRSLKNLPEYGGELDW